MTLKNDYPDDGPLLGNDQLATGTFVGPTWPKATDYHLFVVFGGDLI